MALTVFVIRRTVRLADLLEHGSEKDLVRCERKIDALAQRMEYDRAMVSYARDSRAVMVEFLDTMATLDSHMLNEKARAAAKMAESMPAKPNTKGIFRRRLVAPSHPHLATV